MSAVTRAGTGKVASFAPDIAEEYQLPDPETSSAAAASFAGSAAAAVSQPAFILGLLAALLPAIQQQIAAQSNSALGRSQVRLFDTSEVHHDPRTTVLPSPPYLQEVVQLVPFGDLPSKVQTTLTDSNTRQEFSVIYTVTSWGFDQRDFIKSLLTATGELRQSQAQRQNVRTAVPQQQSQTPTRAPSQDWPVRGRSREPAPAPRPASGGQQQSGP
jgi:hypothetical protein